MKYLLSDFVKITNTPRNTLSISVRFNTTLKTRIGDKLYQFHYQAESTQVTVTLTRKYSNIAFHVTAPAPRIFEMWLRTLSTLIHLVFNKNHFFARYVCGISAISGTNTVSAYFPLIITMTYRFLYLVFNFCVSRNT